MIHPSKKQSISRTRSSSGSASVTGWLSYVEHLLQKIPGASTASDSALAELFGKLGTLLSTGLRIDQAIKTTVPKKPGALRRTMLSALAHIQKGGELGDSLRHSTAFPPLIGELISAAEQSGSVAEVCSHLSAHFQLRVKMRRRLIASLTWPITQFVLAVLIIALVIFILGIISETTGNNPVDILGLGLMGPTGALIFLSGVCAIPTVLFFGYKFVISKWGGNNTFHHMLLHPLSPISRNVLLNFALSRFCWAFHLTSEAASPIDRALALSLRATMNPAFLSLEKALVESIRSGNEVAETLATSDLFPVSFIESSSVGETSGTLPETMERLAGEYQQYGEEALNRALTFLAGTVWVCVAILIIFVIVRIFSSYVSMLNSVF